MESESDQPEKKKRRVTKACDQCRKRRIKCASYPNVAIDAPCVICTEANQAESCTYTRPTRKRGPQPGKSKSLQEKCEALERLLGHLLLAIPSVGPHIEVFFRNSTAESPEYASPSSASSSNAQSTTPQQQIEAFRASRIAQQIENVAVPPPPPATKPLAAMNKKRNDPEADSPAPSSNVSLPTPSPSYGQAALPASSQQQPAFLQTGPFSSPRINQPFPYPFASSSQTVGSQFDIPTNALQALAHAAVPDAENAMEGVVFNPVPTPGSPFASGGERSSKLDIPLLPSESIRNQLLDLYFNQVVQPYFPMLDKTLFLRWSAHLPAVPTRSTTALPSSRLIPPTLYLAVFALSSSYLSPSIAVSTHSPAVWAEAARSHLWAEIDKTPNLETVQAAIIGGIIDWGSGELNRAWIISSIAVTLSINLSLHLSTQTQPDPNSLRLKTFHSALILHTLLSLRLSRAPLVVLEDYNVPIPPVDGNEDFELWRSDKTTTELRQEWKNSPTVDPSAPLIDSPQLSNVPLGGGSSSAAAPVRAPQAVRSASLSTFAKMASLCAIGLTILRWDVCPRRGYGQSLATGEQERVELVESLRSWGNSLENELRLGADQAGGVERLEERARWTVEMHLVVAALNLKLRPHSSFASTAYDPVPSALILLHHILIRYRSLFTMYRSLPIVDFSLNILSATLFQQSDYAPHQHDAPLKAYEELSRLFPVSKSCLEALRSKVDGHKRELGLLRGIHPTGSSVPPPSSSTSANAALSEPFQAFLSYSADLGPSATPQTVLDFGSWDQTDLLFSLGLVGNPNDSMNGWGLPTNAEPQEGLPLPPLIEADFTTLEGAENPASTLDQSLGQFSSPSLAGGGGGGGGGAGGGSSYPLESTTAIQQRYEHSVFDPLASAQLARQAQYQPQPSAFPSTLYFSGTSQPQPQLHPRAQYGQGTNTVEGGPGTSAEESRERSTDLLTRWLSRGSVALEGFVGTGSGGGVEGGGASEGAGGKGGGSGEVGGNVG